MQNTNLICKELTLPCGVVLKNRLGKSAMSENMGTVDNRPNQKHVRLYQTWAEGGVGLCITGNIMVDATALGEPRNVVIERGHENIELLQTWAKAGTKNSTQLWAQLNHPGKQSPKFLSREPVAPSSIEFPSPLNKMFNRPRQLSEQEILGIIDKFAFAAATVKQAGFSGVQIHSAHGYLLSQFLSPKHNQRTDRWGGSLENRMRILLAVYDAIRKAVGPAFPVGIKLNSADFQKGGFSEEDSSAVVVALAERGIDLIEISGGTYEAPSMTGVKVKASTQKREAYFIDYIAKVRKLVKAPLMLTGGFRSPEAMEQALQSGDLDIVGLARALAIDPEFPNKILQGKKDRSQVRPRRTGIKLLDSIFTFEITWYTHQLNRMGKGLRPKPKLSLVRSMLGTIKDLGIQGIQRVRA